MNSGPELNALIYEKCFGISCPSFVSCGRGRGVWEKSLPKYSTDLSEAWKVVEKLNKWKFTPTWECDLGGGGLPITFYATAIFDPVFVKDRPSRLAKAETAAHAICLAALKTFEGTNE